MKSLLGSAFSDRLTVLVQLLGWPALISLLYNWLAIPEAKAAQLGLSLLLALVLLFLLTYLVALAFTAGTPRLKPALRRVPKLAILVMVWGAFIFYTMLVLDKPSWRWTALAVTLILFAPLCAAGLAGLRRLQTPIAWTGIVIFLVVGLHLPWRLIWWVPKLEGLNAQAASAAARFTLAGILFAAAWLMLGASFTATGPEPPASSPHPAPAAAD